MSASAEGVPVDDTAQTAPEGPVDQKAKFKEALARKNAANHARNQVGLEGDNHVSGDSHAAGAKRVFRRKSG